MSSILIEGGYIEAPSLFVAGVEEVSETWQNFVDRGGFTRYPDSLNNDILDRDHRVRINGGTILTTSGLATETPDYDDMSIAGDGIYFADADVIPDDGYTKISVDNDYDDDGKNDVLVVNSDKVSEGDPVEVEVNDSKTPSDYPGAEDGVDPSELYWYISEGSEYCSVSENGEIKGLKAGKCVVVAINPYTSEVVTWNVTIKEETNPDTLDKGNSVALSIAGAVTAGFAALAVATRRFFGRK